MQPSSLFQSRALGASFCVIATLCLIASACSDDAMDKSSGSDAGSSGPSASQTPPMGAAAVEAWIAKGDYKSWNCEAAVHAARAPSPHGFNRICSNDLIADNMDGTDVWPKGAAAVKELYTTASGTKPEGYSVYLKTDDDSAAGVKWYWYERLPGTDSAVADGFGDKGGAKDICVACHMAAGSDAAHTPSAGGRDEVYTAVK